MGGWNKPCASLSTLGFPGSIVSFRRAVWIFIIMIGTDLTTPPSHTTAHTVPFARAAEHTKLIFKRQNVLSEYVIVMPFCEPLRKKIRARLS
jgi:hypothetical protein